MGCFSTLRVPFPITYMFRVNWRDSGTVSKQTKKPVAPGTLSLPVSKKQNKKTAQPTIFSSKSDIDDPSKCPWHYSMPNLALHTSVQNLARKHLKCCSHASPGCWLAPRSPGLNPNQQRGKGEGEGNQNKINMEVKWAEEICSSCILKSWYLKWYSWKIFEIHHSHHSDPHTLLTLRCAGKIQDIAQFPF